MHVILNGEPLEEGEHQLYIIINKMGTCYKLKPEKCHGRFDLSLILISYFERSNRSHTNNITQVTEDCLQSQLHTRQVQSDHKLMIWITRNNNSRHAESVHGRTNIVRQGHHHRF